MRIRKKTYAFDIETYPDYFSLVMCNVDDKNDSFTFVLRGKEDRLCGPWISTINNIIHSSHIVGFNNIRFDTPILVAALNRSPCLTLYKIAQAIIVDQNPYWVIYKRLGLKIYGTAPNYFSQYDIFPILLSSASLKEFAGRIHCRSIQDLPIPPGTSISDKQADELTSYCKLDVVNTISLVKKLKPEIDLRYRMGEKYGIDLRSKGDASIAEEVLKKKLNNPPKPNYKNVPFQYVAPDFIKFSTVKLHSVKRLFESVLFKPQDGRLPTPEKIAQADVRFAGNDYKIGVGGLHSQEKHRYYESTKDARIFDLDVASYYPSIVMKLRMFPKHLGISFLQEYTKIVKERLVAKAIDSKGVDASSLKIVINGTFGKFGSIYSLFYSPESLVNVTVTGQLCLLMLIEMLDDAGIRVLSANTDGVSIMLPKRKVGAVKEVVAKWEKRCGFDLEINPYDILAMRDVNNYIAFKENEVVKRKGVFGGSGLFKSPAGEIIYEAVAEALRTGKRSDITKTIKDCGDIRSFVFVRKVAGGAMYEGELLGRVARFVWGKDSKGEILYANKRANEKKHRRVANSDGAIPVMTLRNEYLAHLDRLRYAESACELYDKIKQSKNE